MSQPRLHSILETLANVAIGYVVAIGAQVLIFPWFGIHETLGQNMAIGASFTVVSILRTYALRRMFNAWKTRM